MRTRPVDLELFDNRFLYDDPVSGHTYFALVQEGAEDCRLYGIFHIRIGKDDEWILSTQFKGIFL